MSNAVVPFKHQPPQAFGSNEEIAAIIERMEALIPVELDDYQRGQANIVRNLDNSYIKAAQLCTFYRLIPGQDVHIIPFGNSFAVDTGVEAWKKAADRYCARAGITYHAHYEELSPAEVKERIGQHYTDGDVGAVCFLWRSDKAQVYELFGGKDALTKGYGHWMSKARYDKRRNQWQADNIPAQRTKQDVARRRALKAALKAEFSLDSLLAAAPNEVREQLEWLNKDAQRAIEDRTPYNRPQTYVTPEGYEVSEQEAAEAWAHEDDLPDDEYIPTEEPTQLPAEEPSDALWEPTPEGEADDYRAMAEELDETGQKLMNWCKMQHAESDGPANVIQYRILAGEIDKLLGKHNHGLLLAVMLGHEVNSDNPPGEKLVRLLLSFIQPELPQRDNEGNTVKNAKGRVAKDPNPNYRPTFVDAIRETWKQISGD